MNPKLHGGIHLSDAVARVAMQLLGLTVRVSGSRGRHGSGTVWSSHGLIITNAHVADSDVHEVEFSTGQKSSARLVARDTHGDLAALSVPVPHHTSPQVQSARGLRPGEMVLALGNPVDGPGALATGIIHCKVDRSPWLIADIRLAPGNSGGPLANAGGAIVGINTMITGSLGCAITSDAVDDFLRRYHLAEVA
jgi:serine protease Do